MGLGSLLGKILGIAGSVGAAPFTGGGSLATLPAILGAGGAAAGAMANSQAGNRGSQFEGQLGLAQLLQRNADSQNTANSQYLHDYIAQQASNQSTQQDAWRKLLSTEHLMNPQAMPNISPYATAAPAPTGQALQGAQALRDQVMSRLVNGSGLPTPTAPVQYDPRTTVNAGLLQPGLLEKILGVASPLASGAGAVLGQPRYGTPGSPILTAADVARMRAASPKLGA